MARLLTRSDVLRLLDMPTCINAVEHAFRQRAEGKPTPSGILGLHMGEGGFHVKHCAMELDRMFYAVKVNANFPSNPATHGLPTIQGVLALYDASNGVPLAVMDSMSITTLRTAAATAVAAKHLALPDADTLAIIGCGVQARAHVDAMGAVRPIKRILAYDQNADAMRAFATTLRSLVSSGVEVVATARDAARHASMVVTCTSARQAFIDVDDVSAGTFIGAVGADSEHKSEISPALMRRANVVTDDLDQAAMIGDLHHAIAAGAMRREDVRAQLGDVILDPRRGRTSDSDIVVFDSTGVALEDVAAAVAVYQRAERDNVGLSVDLAL
jgi:alanine dehydrogenase